MTRPTRQVIFSHKDREKFLRQIDKTTHPSCWLFTGHKQKRGYGIIKIGKRDILTHRAAYTLFIGQIPEGLYICHYCDNPPCCNPAHLFAGTQSDNMTDMVNKGRHSSETKPWALARGYSHGRVTHPERTARGDRSGTAKLTEANVIEILNAPIYRGSQAELARRFGVNVSAICRIIHGQRWKHVEVTDKGGIR